MKRKWKRRTQSKAKKETTEKEIQISVLKYIERISTGHKRNRCNRYTENILNERNPNKTKYTVKGMNGF